MSAGYLLIAGDLEKCGPLARRIAERSGLEKAFANPRLIGLTGGSCRCLGVGGDGCILGTVFERRGLARPLSSLGAGEAATVAASNARSLLASHWGGYVAAIAAGPSVTVLRDPSGDFPCYFVEAGPLTVFASDAELLVKSGVVNVSIDEDEIGRQLWRAFVPVTATALRGLRELLAGFTITLPSHGGHQEQCWNPWIMSMSAGRTATLARRRWSGQSSIPSIRWYHPTAGFFLASRAEPDSSIVAACLARADADAQCLTMFTEDPAGDERRPSRERFATGLGSTWSSAPTGSKTSTSMERIAPQPAEAQETGSRRLPLERVHHAVAAELGADAFVTGNGGDHVFGYSQSAAPDRRPLPRWRPLRTGRPEIAHRRLSPDRLQHDRCHSAGVETCSSRPSLQGAAQPFIPRIRPSSPVSGRATGTTLRSTRPARALPGKAAHVAVDLASSAQPRAEPRRPLPGLQPTRLAAHRRGLPKGPELGVAGRGPRPSARSPCFCRSPTDGRA